MNFELKRVGNNPQHAPAVLVVAASWWWSNHFLLRKFIPHVSYHFCTSFGHKQRMLDSKWV